MLVLIEGLAAEGRTAEIERCKNLAQLKSVVAYRLHKKGLHPDKSWDVLRIDLMDKDPAMSAWLADAVKRHKILKKRSKFRVFEGGAAQG